MGFTGGSVQPRKVVLTATHLHKLLEVDIAFTTENPTRVRKFGSNNYRGRPSVFPRALAGRHLFWNSKPRSPGSSMVSV